MHNKLGWITKILHEHWDPIGISTEPVAQDEYETLAGKIVSALQAGATTGHVASILMFYETDDLGLTPQPERAHAVAKLLVADD